MSQLQSVIFMCCGGLCMLCSVEIVENTNSEGRQSSSNLSRKNAMSGRCKVIKKRKQLTTLESEVITIQITG